MTAGAAIAFCAKPIKDDVGRIINDTVFLELPPNKSEWQELLMKLIVRTSAIAVVVVDFRFDQVKAIFETPLGSRAWTMKPERHGDTKMLSKPIVLDDVESSGLLWTARATA